MDPEKSKIYITKADGTKEPFDRNKLIGSLTNSGGSPEIIERIVKHVEDEVRSLEERGKKEPTSADIYHHAFELLRKDSLPAATRYSLRKALIELGPNGFPFERFVADIFKVWKYETLTDQVVHGHCVDHEVDVVAWNPEKLVMVEAKFHNEFGLKSDIKVALYVKARMDDIRAAGATFDYGGKPRAMDEGWLVTNTKFTDQAIKYGECAGLTMVGWNYPRHNNLHDLIEQARLHPFTCLATLSNVHKKNLLTAGVLLCREITPKVLKQAGLEDEKIDTVMAEVDQVCGA
jgi:hypothetical protein